MIFRWVWDRRTNLSLLINYSPQKVAIHVFFNKLIIFWLINLLIERVLLGGDYFDFELIFVSLFMTFPFMFGSANQWEYASLLLQSKYF